MSQKLLAVIGAGNMAEALLRGALSSGVLKPGDVLIYDPSPQRRELMGSLGIEAAADILLCARAARLLLAVKPQIAPAVLAEIAPAVAADLPVISIVAGLRTAAIAQRLGGKGRIVRVMPNTPMLAGAGMSAVCSGVGATQADLDWTGRLFAAAGKVIAVEEGMMDAVTAVSGSGPAYFFYLTEAMAEAGVAEGLAPEVAEELAVQTLWGAAKLLAHTGKSPQALRAQVTSPNGTTQAAIESLDAAGTRATIVAAVRRAAQRSKELGK